MDQKIEDAKDILDATTSCAALNYYGQISEVYMGPDEDDQVRFFIESILHDIAEIVRCEPSELRTQTLANVFSYTIDAAETLKESSKKES